MINIGLIEDEPVILEYYKEFFRKSAKFNCTLAVNSVESFLSFFRPYQSFHIILVDIGLPGISGIEGLKILRKNIPDAELVIFTAHQDNDKIFKALRAGASGYLLKSSCDKELEEKLGAILNGEAAISPPIARRLIEYFNPPKQIRHFSKEVKLSIKENQIVKLLIEGFSYSKIALEIGISINGVRYHIKNIYHKLHVNSKVEILKQYKNGDLKINYGDET